MDKYFVEQINVTDDKYTLISLDAVNGGFIESNSQILSYESSKTVFDLVSRQAGFCYLNPCLDLGGYVNVGSLLCVVVESPLSDEEFAIIFESHLVEDTQSEVTHLGFSKKAVELIEKSGLQFDQFSNDAFVSVNNVKKALGINDSIRDLASSYFGKPPNFYGGKKKLAVIGAGKAALQVLDSVVSASDYEIVSFYDGDNSKIGKRLMGIPVYGPLDIERIHRDFKNGLFDSIVISFSSDVISRKELFFKLKDCGLPIANVIHPTALISPFACIGEGNLIFANTRIGPFSSVGDNNVISSYCSIEHHNILGSHNTFGPSVVTSGSCKIGSVNKFGTGIYIEPNVQIEEGCIIGSGVILTRNVPPRSLIKTPQKINIVPRIN